MKKVFFLLSFVFLLFTVYSLLFTSSAKADEYDDLQKKIDDLNKALEMSRAATVPLESTLKNLDSQIASIREQIAYLEGELVKKGQEVADSEKLLSYQEQILQRKVRSLYKNMYQKSSLNLEAVFGNNLANTIRVLGYQKSVVTGDKNTISEVVMYIKDLEEKKKEIESESARLAKAKEDIDTQAEFFRKEIAGAKKYQMDLGKEIVQLSARQQEILAQRLASLNIPQSAYTTQGGCRSDLDIDPGFSPRIGFFTLGVPNRVGLNQYGAKGRAEAGQNAEDILRAYYNFDELKKDYNTGITIHVEGYGDFNIEDYVKRIYEVPEGWPIESLKAQAVAARSYVLAYTNNGAGSICTTEKCQVFKPDPKGGAWDQAANETRGWVMIQGGNPVKAWFSSTHGGYVYSSGEIGWSSTSWTKHIQDTTGGVSSFDNLKNNAYDRSSPWFYCDWGSRDGYNKTAWLKSDEVADIVNTLMLVKKDSGTAENLYQTDKSNPAGKETWDAERVKSELKSRGVTPYNNVSGISVGVDFGFGKTNSVNVDGDAGSNSFDGNDFKNRFNLRAPANLQIVGPLYNVEKRG